MKAKKPTREELAAQLALGKYEGVALSPGVWVFVRVSNSPAFRVGPDCEEANPPQKTETPRMKTRIFPQTLSCVKCRAHGLRVAEYVVSSDTTGFTTPKTVVATLQCGHVQKFGVTEAWVNGGLELEGYGGFINDRNELVRRWREGEEVAS